MGEFKDKIRGLANQAIGKTKVAAGRAADNSQLVAKGMAQWRKGKAQQAAGAIRGLLGDKI
jgi:uncharacterized protein YjbJ (UPF0337 family)